MSHDLQIHFWCSLMHGTCVWHPTVAAAAAAGAADPAGAHAAVRQSRKRKASALVIDDLDDLQIRWGRL